jgi:hypothetical protein
MINEEAAKVLLDASKNIYRWAKKGGKPEDKETAVSKRAHEAAWRSVAHLIPLLEHAKESDHYWILLENAIKLKKSAKEQYRLHTIAKQEDREFMRKKEALEKLISENIFIEKTDPRGLSNKAEAEENRIRKNAAEARNVEEVAIQKALKRVTSEKDKKELYKRSDAASAAYIEVVAKAQEEKEEVFLKLGLTPMSPSHNFLKAQKVRNKAVAKKSV